MNDKDDILATQDESLVNLKDEDNILSEVSNLANYELLENENYTNESECLVIENLKKERDNLVDTTKRIQADFINYKKRVEGDKNKDIDIAISKFLKDFVIFLEELKIIDENSNDENIRNLKSKFKSILTDHGVGIIGEEDDTFNPKFLTSIEHDEGNGGDILIKKIFRQGYVYKEIVVSEGIVSTYQKNIKEINE